MSDAGKKDKGGGKKADKKGGKKGGDKKGGAKKSRGPIVANRTLALLGLLGLGTIAVMMLRGELDLVAGGQRAGVLLGVVLVAERVALPVCRALVGPPLPPEHPEQRSA